MFVKEKYVALGHTEYRVLIKEELKYEIVLSLLGADTHNYNVYPQHTIAM